MLRAAQISCYKGYITRAVRRIRVIILFCTQQIMLMIYLICNRSELFLEVDRKGQMWKAGIKSRMEHLDQTLHETDNTLQ